MDDMNEYTADEGMAPPPPDATFIDEPEPEDGDLYEDDPDYDPDEGEE